jgi:uncharacterized protein (TIGR02757 family)
VSPRAEVRSGSKRLDVRELERLYRRYNRPSFRSSDPVEFVHRYGDPRDREVAGIVASSLAFGSVKQIRASVERALGPLGRAPAAFLAEVPFRRLAAVYRGFKHRWITGEDLAGLLDGVREAMAAYGSLGGLFMSRLDSKARDTGSAAGLFADEIRRRGRCFRGCLLPSPRNGSACKRLHLFLRWMIRKDEIDAGLWPEAPASILLVPLDVHAFRAARAFGLTRRGAADHAAAVEVTAGFREISPADPVKYDFAIAHEGMNAAARAGGSHD